MKDNLFIRHFEWQEKRCYKSARSIVVVTDSFKKKLVAKGIDHKKIFVVKNGVNKELFQPMEKDGALQTELGLHGKTVIGYIGTHGMAHKLDFILKCAQRLKGSDYHFLFLGEGAEREHLLQLKEELGCTNVTMLKSVSKNEVKRYISVLDICMINLRKSDLFKTVIPSKIFENAAMGIPILMGVEGEAQEIVESYNAGLCFEPENEEDFIIKLREFDDKAKYAAFKKGCFELADDFDRKNLAGNMYEVIQNTCNGSKS